MCLAGFTRHLLFGNLGLCLVLLLGNLYLGFVDGLGSSFLTEGLDIARFVLDIGDVHVDEFQTDLLELYLDVLLDVLLEDVTVLVEFLDRHGGDDETELAEKNITSHVLNVVGRKTKQTLSSVVHRVGLGADTHGEAAGNVDADVLAREGIGEVRFNRDRGEVEVGVVLDDRPYEHATTMYTLG